MAGMKMRVSTSGEIAATTSAKTILRVKAAAATPFIYRGGGISFNGVTATDKPIIVKLVIQSSDGTPGSAITPVNENQAVTYTPQCTANENFSSTEPTISGILASWEIHPQGGGLIEDLAINEPIIVTGRLGLQVTSANAVNCLAFFKIEE